MALCLMAAVAPPRSCAQATQKLTLSEALALARNKSQSVEIARAGVRSADAERLRARAQRLPQLFGNLSYTRTLASQYADLFRDETPRPVCAPLTVNPGAPVEQRIAELERFLACGGPAAADGGLGAGFQSLPFGRTNIYTLGLTASQAVFAGGRLTAQSRLADALYDTAAIELESTEAQFLLDVSTAFYDAALADSLLAIARATLEDAEKTLDYVRLGFKVGRLPEFELLRAAVRRRNQLPAVARSEAARDQAYLRFKQLLDVPAATDLILQADLAADELPVPEPFAPRFNQFDPVQVAEKRAPVRQAEAGVRQREANLDIARSQRWPSLSISSDFGLFGYPKTVLPTATDQFRKNWSVSAALQLPILTFGRVRADIRSAESNVQQAVAQERLTREISLLDSSIALSQLRTALEQWKAVTGGLVEAQRAFEIAGLRYRQGISSQIELDDARLGLQQAQVNRAQAARDLQVARITLALLPLLPINTAAQAPSQARPLQLQQSQQQFGGTGINPFGNAAAGTARAPNSAPPASGIPGVPAGQVGIPGAARPVQ